MGWDSYYRRRDAIDAVLAAAATDSEAGLPFSELPEVAEAFESREDVALALQYKWSQLLNGRINLALADTDYHDGDPVEAVSKAWRATAADNPVLRRLLDTYAEEAGPEFQIMRHEERSSLALSAGLASPSEPDAEIGRIGDAFLRLIRSAPQPTAVRRRNPVEQLLRKLVSTS